ncbi:MAG: hypothetical protein BWY43_00552 [candidate division WS2 bacterium ADurb.Bin280]|uniref:Uncharacterized protein n=1 Tax=candidate division WS2 bacterium ADurb.Bin280 TaxID=1852829 RepID=A0A1V5SDE1_9BACT|nr:MAG: hypothetical protein BWY43_00552 [candidate division WS2 bacterium ADurb.Bin280]
MNKILKQMTPKQRILLYVSLVIAGILLVALMLLTHAISKKSDENALIEDQAEIAQSTTATVSPTKTATIAPTSTLTATVTPSPTATASVDPSRDLNSVKAVVANFMQAYISRSLDQAKPYMTDEFFASFTNEDFAGVSSSSRSGYEIASSGVIEEDSKYEAKVYLHYELNGQPSGTSIFQLQVFKKSDKFLVSSMSESQ